jgi:hypothetical protein
MRQVLAVLASVLFASCGGQLPVSQAGSDSAGVDVHASDAADTTKADVASSGIGHTCAANADCALFGLYCQINAGAPTGFCSKACGQDGDCSPSYFCNNLGSKRICTTARYCNHCASASDCSPDAPLCVPDSQGAGYCAHACSVGDKGCPPGASCKQYGSGVNDSACAPDYGTCSGDGAQCSPCDIDGDCSPGNVCFTSPTTQERFCDQTCDPAKAGGCPPGFACAAHKSGSAQGLCWRQFGKEVLATCAKGDKGYCDACDENYECASNRCASKLGKKFCAEPMPCEKATEASDCPYGGEATYCVPADVGNICAPPPSYNCQGFKACLGHPCQDTQECDNGICKSK